MIIISKLKRLFLKIREDNSFLIGLTMIGCLKIIFDHSKVKGLLDLEALYRFFKEKTQEKLINNISGGRGLQLKKNLFIKKSIKFIKGGIESKKRFYLKESKRSKFPILMLTSLIYI